MHLQHNLPTVFFVGNSHTAAVYDALKLLPFDACKFEYFVLDLAAFGNGSAYQLYQTPDKKVLLNEQVFQAFESVKHPDAPAHYFSMIGGNDHLKLSVLQCPTPFDFILPEEPELPLSDINVILPYEFVKDLLARFMRDPILALIAFRDGVPGNVYHIESPPPIGDDEYFTCHMEPVFREYLELGKTSIAPRMFRYKMWRLHSCIMRETCEEHGITFIPTPKTVTDTNGFLKVDAYCQHGVCHGNEWYGMQIIDQVNQLLTSGTESVTNKPETPIASPDHPVHPYKKIETYAHWRKAIAEVQPEQVDPATGFRFIISPTDRVATAGSCFAQHISRHLKKSGFNYFTTEGGPIFADSDICEKFNFGTFSARFGNIYTSRQLLQLFDRAYGNYAPLEDIWRTGSDRVIDPFRPNIQPGGFVNEADFREERKTHLRAVREMFDSLDYFIFTLGLTECWISSIDGAVFPICPGVAGGNFNREIHRFVNLGVEDVFKDMSTFIEKLQSVNPTARIILTVSPVPLIATAENRHVLVSTSYSKSVLRVACEMLVKKYRTVDYFPAYEIITGSFNRGSYFGPDLRGVTEEGVQHVMRLFMLHATDAANYSPDKKNDTGDHVDQHPLKDANENYLANMQLAVQTVCDEELLDRR